jgi:hypothetical protein
MLIPHLIAGVRRALRLHRPGRELNILPDDTFLVSYPKSGNTWVRLLLANLLSPTEPADFAAINRLVPDPAAQNKRLFDRMPRPRVIKSHFCFDPRYPKVIYIVRDPRDVVISEYHYQRKTRRISDDYTLEEYVPRFLSGKTWPENGSWAQHVATWVTARDGDPGFLLIRYETLLASTTQELARMASFLGISVTSQRLFEVVERSSADRMRTLEALQSEQSSLMKGSRKDIAFVRSAKSGGWKSDLTEPLVAKIEAAWSPIMRYLGYELRFPTSVDGVDPTAFAFSKMLQ